MWPLSHGKTIKISNNNAAATVQLYFRIVLFPIVSREK